MEIIDFYKDPNKEYWLNKISESDWDAADFLCELIRKNELISLLGKETKLFLLVDNKELISFLTFSNIDDIETDELTPWIGFVYTFPKFRGNRYIGKLIDHVKIYARDIGYDNIYISTNAIGLYEKYGFTFYKILKDRSGEDSRVYSLK